MVGSFSCLDRENDSLRLNLPFLNEELTLKSYLLNSENTVKSFTYTPSIEKELEKIRPLLAGSNYIYPDNWLAIKLLEKDKDIIKYIDKNGTKELKNKIDELVAIESDLELEIIDNRYRFVNRLLSEMVSRHLDPKVSLTAKIDKIVTHKFWGIPIFGFIMFIVFQLTFLIGEDLLGDPIENLLLWINNGWRRN